MSLLLSTSGRKSLGTCGHCGTARHLHRSALGKCYRHLLIWTGRIQPGKAPRSLIWSRVRMPACQRLSPFRSKTHFRSVMAWSSFSVTADTVFRRSLDRLIDQTFVEGAPEPWTKTFIDRQKFSTAHISRCEHVACE